MLLEQRPFAQTHTLLSAVLLRCMCVYVSMHVPVHLHVYYLYIRCFSVSAGIANMFLNISGEIAWNFPVAKYDSLTALSGPQPFQHNSLTHAETCVRTYRCTRTHLQQSGAADKVKDKLTCRRQGEKTKDLNLSDSVWGTSSRRNLVKHWENTQKSLLSDSKLHMIQKL